VNTARIRFTALSGPDGYSRVGIETRFDVENSADFRLAGSYWDTPNNPALPTRRIEIAEQFVIAENPAAVAVQPFIFEGGNLRVPNAFIRNLTAENIDVVALTSDMAFINSLQVGWAAIEDAVVNNLVVDSAMIGTATIDTLNLVNGAVTNTQSNSSGSGFVAGLTNVDFSATLTGYVSGVVQVAARLISTQNITPNAAYVEVSILRGGTQIFYHRRTGDETNPSSINQTFFLLDLPPSAGNHTYTMRIRTNISPGWNYTSRLITISNAKR
jgi:hypothetical protein